MIDTTDPEYWCLGHWYYLELTVGALVSSAVLSISLVLLVVSLVLSYEKKKKK